MPQTATESRSRPKTVRMYTFGCKVNQFDTSAMETLLRGTGRFEIREDSESPDVVVVNTCTVTAEADRQARQLIRRIHRTHPEAKIVVTGCYAESEPDLFRDMEGVDAVLSIAEQRRLPVLLGEEAPADGTLLVVDSSRTRATLKMQDGCNAYCSFCILPYLRGRSRSVSLEELRSAAKGLSERGFREIVVTGVHLAAYGRDLKPQIRLSDALKAISVAAPGLAIRVSSLEPAGITPDFLNAIESLPIQPHFHIPLQSGSDAVLRRMNRKHTSKAYGERVRSIAKVRPEAAIGADVIVGFPGESRADFEETVRFIRALPISYLHVFSFSARPGTKAAEFENDVPGTERAERVKILRGLGFERRREFYGRFFGTVQKVLIERKRDRDGLLTGYTPHYVAIHLPGGDSLMGTEVPVRLGKIAGLTSETLHFVGEIADAG
ncbi:MAG: tRNA (N(6)-L-threonylcarbamoyladenosine(37)-C(2))-methylthiotransferase MtaB [Pseudomonadota bacterium]